MISDAFGPGWALELNGSIGYGTPGAVRFQGVGIISGAQWIYDYIGYVIPAWPNGVNQRPAMAGSIVRTIPHPGGDGGRHPAGVVLGGGPAGSAAALALVQVRPELRVLLVEASAFAQWRIGETLAHDRLQAIHVIEAC